MEFATSYSSPMDYQGLGSRDIIREPYPDETPSISSPILPSEYGDGKIPGTGVGDIGMSVPMGIAAGNIRGVSLTMRSGMKNLEIQFPGAGRGNRQSQTPELYGKLDRQALWELAKINEVSLTTHSSMGISGLSGQDPNSGNFSEEYRKMSIDEVKRAIEFAADTAGGGSVVVHTGEFQRPISEQDWAKGGEQFKAYGAEPERAVLRVVDRRTGQVLSQVRKNQVVFRPDWMRYEEDTPRKDDNGHVIKKGDFIDYEGNWIDPSEDNMYNRVPKFNPNTGRFEAKEWKFEDFQTEADKQNKGKSRDEWITPEELFIQASIETNYGQARGWGLYHAQRFDHDKSVLDGAKSKKEYLEKMKSELPPEKWDKFKANWLASNGASSTEDPITLMDKQIFEARHSLEHTRQGAVGYEQQAKEALLLKEYATTIEKYAMSKSIAGYAEAAMHAYNLTKQRNLKQPLLLTLENIFPESYGAHPQELKRLVFDARKEMARELVEQKKVGNKEQAMKIAEKHIKATLDTGHINTWRKYFQAKSGETVEQTDNRFRSWVLKETEELAKADVVGNVHLADNMGYQDDHLAPGQGTTPVRDIVNTLRKHGYKGPLTVEPGGDATTDLSAFHGLMKTWRYFGSQVYGMTTGGGMGGDRMWRDVQNSYFRYMQKPYFIFGSYVPSNDWTFWTGVPIE